MKNKINIFFQKVIVDNLETNIKYLLIIFLIFGVYFKSENIYIYRFNIKWYISFYN